MKLPLYIRRFGGIFLILLFYLAGNVLSRWSGHVVPGSVIGMLLLFFSLIFRIVRPEAVSDAAQTLTSSMALFFIPAGVGVMVYWDVLAENQLVIVAACAISTVLIMGTVGWIQEFLERRSAHE